MATCTCENISKQAYSPPLYKREASEKIIFSVITSLSFIPPIQLLGSKIIKQIRFLNPSSQADPISIWNFLKGGLNPLQTILKSLFIFYVVILGPVIEERFFRDSLQNKLKSILTDLGCDLTYYKTEILLHVLNGALFGLFHLSPFQGVMNLPVFVTTTLLGIFFSWLKEKTGDLKAPTTAHILNNGVIVAGLFWMKA